MNRHATGEYTRVSADYSRNSTGGLLRRARDGHTTLTLLLLAVHVEREGERTLAETLGLLLQLLQLTLRQTAELEPRFLNTQPCRKL